MYYLYWSNYQKGYIGSQYGANAHPSNIWNSYFTSSAIVADYRKTHGDPDKIYTIPCDEYDGQAEHLEASLIRACRIQHFGGSFLNSNAYGSSSKYSDEYVHDIYKMVGNCYETSAIIDLSSATVFNKLHRLRNAEPVDFSGEEEKPLGQTVVKWIRDKQKPQKCFAKTEQQQTLLAISGILFEDDSPPSVFPLLDQCQQ